MRKDAALADELELGEAFKQRATDLGALADQHQGLGVLEALGQCVGVLDVVVPDGDVVAGELGEGWQRADGVEVVVENRDFHEASPFRGAFLLLRGQGVCALSPAYPK